MPLFASIIMLTLVRYRSAVGSVRNNVLLVLFMFFLVFLISWALGHGATLRNVILVLPVVGVLLLSYAIFTRCDLDACSKWSQFLLYMVLAVFFWSIYMMLPTILLLYVKDNVTTKIFGVVFSPQWLDLIDSITVIVSTSALVHLYGLLKHRYAILLPTSVVFMLGFLVLSGACAIVGFSHWSPLILVASYIVLQSVAESFIGPEGQALSGRLVPKAFQGVTTGAWQSTLGIACLVSSAVTSHVMVHHNEITSYDLAQFYRGLLPCVLAACVLLWCMRRKSMRRLLVNSVSAAGV